MYVIAGPCVPTPLEPHAVLWLHRRGTRRDVTWSVAVSAPLTEGGPCILETHCDATPAFCIAIIPMGSSRIGIVPSNAISSTLRIPSARSIEVTVQQGKNILP